MDLDEARLRAAFNAARGTPLPAAGTVGSTPGPAGPPKVEGECEVCSEGGVSIYKGHGFAVDWKQVATLVKSGKSVAEALTASTSWEPESRLCSIFMRDVFWAEVKRQEDRGALFPLKKALEAVRAKYPEGSKCLPVKFP